MRIVAELGINTQGSLDTALQMVEAAAEAGADGIKVQAYECKDFLPEGHPDWNLFWRNRLSWDAIRKVQELTVDLGLEFGATPTSHEGIQRLSDMRVDWLKNGSDFLLRHDLIDSMLRTGLETWVSTGMATEEEVAAIPDGAKIMACTSVYPCDDNDANLHRLLRPRVCGYSDHTVGTTAAVLACALGAEMWEGHFTIDKTLPGPDHAFSRDFDDLAHIVEQTQRATILLGSSRHQPAFSEKEHRELWRVTKDTLRG